MLTVTVKTKKGQVTVEENTLEVRSVRQTTTDFRYMDGQADEHPGVYLHFDNEGTHTHYGPRDDGFWYDIFVMNEAGVTVNRLTV